MQKDKLILVTDPEIIAAIERNDFGDPVPVEKNEQGYWAYAWSLEQYRERVLQRERQVCSAVASELDSSESDSTGRSR